MIIRLAALVAFTIVTSGLTADPSAAEEPSIDELLEDLARGTAFERYAAAEALAENPHDPQRAIPVLVIALEDERIGKEFHPLVPAPRPSVADEVETALGSYGAAAVPRVTNLLRHSKQKVRTRAAAILERIGAPAAVSAPALAAAFRQEKEKSAKAVYLRAYGILEPDSVKLTQVLLETLTDSDLKDNAPDVYALAIRIGGKRQLADNQLIKQVRAGLDDPRSRLETMSSDSFFMKSIREDAAEALGRIGPAAKEAEPKLRTMWKSDEELSTRVVAAFAVFQLMEGDGDEEALGFLTGIAAKPTNGELGATIHSIRLLGAIGPKARSALPALDLASTYDSAQTAGLDGIVRHEALTAAALVAGSESLPMLKRALQSDDPLDRAAAADAVSSLGSNGIGALTDLIQAAREDRVIAMGTYSRGAAIRAIGNLGRDAESAIPALSELARVEEGARGNDWLAKHARQAIEKITKSKESASPVLK